MVWKGGGQGRTGNDTRHGRVEREMTEGTVETAKKLGGRPQTTENPPTQRSDNVSGGKYRVGGSDTEDSADKIAKWGVDEMEESALEEEATTAGGAGEAGRPFLETAKATEESGADGKQGGAVAGRSAAADATSAAANKAGAGGRHGARTWARERVAGRQENPSCKSSGVGGGGEGREANGVASEPSGVRVDEEYREAYRVAENPGGDHQGVEGELSCRRALTPQSVNIAPGGTKSPEWPPRAKE